MEKNDKKNIKNSNKHKDVSEANEQLNQETKLDSLNIETDDSKTDADNKNFIEKLQNEIEDYICVAKRIKAEFDNYRKRNENIIEKTKEDAIDKVILDFIEVNDSIDAALSMIKDETSQKGVELIKKQFTTILDKYEVEEINPINKPFNPELHDAIMQEENENQSGYVTQVFKKGYLKNKKVIRYAIVKVAI